MEMIEKKQKRWQQSWAAALFTVRQLHRIDFIFSHVFAILLCGIVAGLLHANWLLPCPPKYHHFIYMVLESIAAVQILKSSFRSLLLPVLCLVLAAAGLVIVHFKLFALHVPVSVPLLHAMAAVGTIGICIAALMIN